MIFKRADFAEKIMLFVQLYVNQYVSNADAKAAERWTFGSYFTAASDADNNWKAKNQMS